MEYRECEECKRTYGYFDSPPAEKCFCGGILRVIDLRFIDTNSDNYFEYNPEFATVSC